MSANTRSQKTSERPAFKVGDRVRVKLGPRGSLGTIIEDRGYIGSGGRHLFGVNVDFDPPNVTYIELPEDELAAEK